MTKALTVERIRELLEQAAPGARELQEQLKRSGIPTPEMASLVFYSPAVGHTGQGEG